MSVDELFEDLVDYFADSRTYVLVQEFSFFVLNDVVAVPVELFVRELIGAFLVDHPDRFLKQLPTLGDCFFVQSIAGKFIDLERHFFFQIYIRIIILRIGSRRSLAPSSPLESQIDTSLVSECKIQDTSQTRYEPHIEIEDGLFSRTQPILQRTLHHQMGKF